VRASEFKIRFLLRLRWFCDVTLCLTIARRFDVSFRLIAKPI